MVALVGVLAVSAVTLGWLALRSSDTDQARAVADRFVGDLESSDYAGAYGLLSRDARAAASETRFAQAMDGQPRRVRGHRIDGVNSSTTRPRPYIAVFLRLTFTDGDTATYNLVVVPKSGRWLVQGTPFWGVRL
jgi:hypothetical protein